MPTRRRAVALVLAGGLVAGTLDIAYAWGFWALRALFARAARYPLGS